MAALFGTAFVNTAVLVTGLFAPFSFGQGVSEPSIQSMVTRYGAGRMRGQLLGLYQSSRSLALIIGPIWSGSVFEILGPQTVFAVGGGFTFIALLLAIVLSRQSIPEMEAPTRA